MKRTDFFMKLITAVLFLAVISYIGVYIYNAAINTYVTIPAVSFAIEDAFTAEGYIVRTEIVLTDYGEAILPTVGEGAKVGSGQTVAVEYTSRAALETANEIRTIRLRIAQLEAPGVSVESTCFNCVTALSAAVNSGDLSGLDELSMNIETNIFSGGAASSFELPNLQTRLSVLEGRSAGVRTIPAPVSGVFSQVVDGYERVGPGDLSDISPSGLTALFSYPSSARGVGKLVTEFRWVYAAVMDAADASRLHTGRSVTVQFTGAYNEQMNMTVESVGRRDEDQCVVILSSDRGVHEIARLRYMRAEIIFNVVTGIRVPKEAIHLDDDGATFIYLQTGVRAERVDVEILLETGDSYLVRDGAETGLPLRAGSTIIVRANGLYDGKVVG